MEGSRLLTTVTVIAVAVLILDQVSKALIVAVMGPAQSSNSVRLIGDWISLEYAENRGVAFGLFSGAGTILVFAAAATLIVLAWHVFRSPRQSKHQMVAFGLILGGAAGNLLDRFRLGYVVDFVSVGWWPNFNLADSAISVGVALMLFGWLFAEQQSLWQQARH